MIHFVGGKRFLESMAGYSWTGLGAFSMFVVRLRDVNKSRTHGSPYEHISHVLMAECNVV